MRLLLGLALAWGLISSVGGSRAVADLPRVVFGEGEPLPAMNGLFERKVGWIGADGAHSVILGPQRRLWLFSDTWVGSVRDGKRFDATIVNNSIGVQEGVGDAARVRFVIRQNGDKKCAALFTPADGRGWFWLQAGAYANKRLYLFLSQVEKTGEEGVFGFRQIGQVLGTVSNPEDNPAQWRLEQRKLPFTIFRPDRQTTFGAAVLADGKTLYLYGTDEEVKPSGRTRELIVARVPGASIEDFASWRFYSGNGWDADFRKASRMVGNMASEASVLYLDKFKRYVLVYTEGGLSDRILARTASAPTGPWSAPRLLYRCPEPKWDKKIFCYAAKAHPHLGAPNEMVVSYVANSFDFWQVAADSRLYWPRFIRVKVRTEE
jgi:Domain of unknown function (DUF4185)